jgi:hypothetical protein
MKIKHESRHFNMCSYGGIKLKASKNMAEGAFEAL